MAGERTEAPTPKRLREARQQGDVSKSEELVSVGVLLLAVFALRALGPALWHDLGQILADGLARPSNQELTPGAALALGQDSGMQVLRALAPLFGLLAAAGLVLNVAQTGFVLSTARLRPKLTHVSPATGIKRIVSVEGLIGMVKALVKLGVVTVVVWLTMTSQLAEIAGLGQRSVAEGAARLAGLSFEVALRAAGALFVLAVLDFAWQRRRHLSRLRMTKEEVRQELRETEGDPHIKAAIRRRRQALLNRMIAAVPRADVVVTNPTHYAVAIKYDPVSMRAPAVVAKGERLLAARIKEVAQKAGVPILEEPPLARALYAAVPVGQQIPANLFHAVAEVLAWVYALRSRRALGGAPGRRPAGATG
jgi:flagellar biosynthetic protein FlhB